jgi:hypothetical protein
MKIRKIHLLIILISTLLIIVIAYLSKDAIYYFIKKYFYDPGYEKNLQIFEVENCMDCCVCPNLCICPDKCVTAIYNLNKTSKGAPTCPRSLFPGS